MSLLAKIIALFVSVVVAVVAPSTAAHAVTVKRPATTGYVTATFDYTDGASGDPTTNVVATWKNNTPGQPWVVLIHGGTWSAGNNTYYESQMADLFQRYGWATFNVGYPLIPDVTGAQQEQDIFQAVTWVRAHWWGLHLDVNKGTLYGFSAGGHLAALTGLEHPGLVQDIVTASGVLQPHRLADDILGKRADEPIDPVWGPYAMARMNQWTGCEYVTCGADSPAWQSFEPQTYITPNSAPMWIISGGADPIVHPQMTDAFGYWLGQKGVEHHLTIAPGFGHTEADIYTVTANAQSMLKFVMDHVHAGSW